MISDAQLLAAISSAEETALGLTQGSISSDREDAINRYLGKTYGDEQPGRSQVVSRDVADVVEGVVANVVRPIVSGDEIIQFDPVGPDDEERAEQETDYVNMVATQRNNGFVWLVSSIKDALLLRAGYVKLNWEVRSDVMIEHYQGLSDEELNLLIQDGGVEVVNHSAYPAPNGQASGQSPPPAPPMLHDVRVRRIKPTEYARVDPVPADEILVSVRARTPSLQEADFVQHRPHKTLSELRQAGYDVPDDITDDDAGATMEEMARQRFGSSGNVWDDETSDPSRRQVLFKESYLRIDRDGDGLAELRRVCSIGQTILADDECEDIPIAAFCGLLLSHQHLGLSVYDLVEDIAKIKTALLRSYLDNRRLQNDGRWAVATDNVNLDDFLVSRPGGVVRVTSGNPADSIMPLTAQDTSTGALQGLEYLDSVREQRSGYTRNTGGIANDALTNRTASGMAMQLSQSQLRLEMIARTLAETGLKDVYRLIHAMTLRHSTRAEKVRLKGKWIEVNPREWFRRSDMSITMGLGTGTPEQQLGRLMALTPMMQQLAGLGLVGVQQAYNFAQEAYKLSGYKTVDRFVRSPPIDPQTGQVKEPQSPPPPEVLVEQVRQQGKAAELQQKTQGDQARLAMEERVQQSNDARDATRAQYDAQLKQQQAEREMRQRDLEHQREQETRIAEAKIKAFAQLQAARITAKETTAEVSVQDLGGDVGIDVAPDPVIELAKSVQGLMQHLASPKEIVRDARGRAVGVRTVQQTMQ